MKAATVDLIPGDVLTLGVMGRETVLTVRPAGHHLWQVTVRRQLDDQVRTFHVAAEAMHEVAR